jgi:vacuolar-type H+-ATPase subunit I/STV1
MSNHLNPANVQKRLDAAHDAGKVKSAKQLADFSTELLDSEIQQAVKIIAGLQQSYAHRANTVENLDKLRDEVLTRLSDINILATFDPTPCFYGEPPVVEFVGKVSTDAIHTDGFDHEQKGWEVRKAKARDEHFLGEKERVNTRVPKEKKSD